MAWHVVVSAKAWQMAPYTYQTHRCTTSNQHTQHLYDACQTASNHVQQTGRAKQTATMYSRWDVPNRQQPCTADGTCQTDSNHVCGSSVHAARMLRGKGVVQPGCSTQVQPLSARPCPLEGGRLAPVIRNTQAVTSVWQV
jgi:hypothetical protein